MFGNPYIFKTARRMIDRYGRDALRQVDARIAELSRPDSDNSDACRIWQQVRETILAIREESSGNSTH